jgi:acetoin utilization deacetylase AcuC-like enzyme
MAPFRRLQRVGRRLFPAGRGRRPWFLYHARYRRGLTGVPMDAMRGERVLTWLLDEGWVPKRKVVTPRPSSLENLLRVHPADYLRSLEDPTEVGRILGLQVTVEEAQAALAMQRLAAGGTLQAARLALRSRGVAFHLGGGFHHAGPARGTGFCLLNDVGVAIRRLRARGFDAPVLVVDLDLHDGNGTRAIFADDPTVYTYSLHNQHWEPPEAVADTSIAFGAGIEDGAYLELLRSTLPPVVDAHAPGLTLYLAGVDPGADDSYGDARLTRAALLERDRFVTEVVGSPLAIVLAGGYGPSAWRATARYAAWLATGEVEEPPDDLRMALVRADRRWEDEAGPRGRRRPPPGGDPFAWSLDSGDLAALGLPDAGQPTLLLDRFTRRDVEAQLERFGILAQLRNRGYAAPEVELHATTGLGPVVRVWGEAERVHLLVELRLELDRRSLPGHPMLRLEWLLLQDPRASFTASRPPLPGQEHPGLGSLADVVAWLVTLCRALELDGILFRTDHWHVAALARRHLRFLSEEDARRFARVHETTRGLSLLEAGAAAAWEEVPMVIPVGKGLDGRTWVAPSARARPDDGEGGADADVVPYGETDLDPEAPVD